MIVQASHLADHGPLAHFPWAIASFSSSYEFTSTMLLHKYPSTFSKSWVKCVAKNSQHWLIGKQFKLQEISRRWSMGKPERRCEIQDVNYHTTKYHCLECSRNHRIGQKVLQNKDKVTGSLFVWLKNCFMDELICWTRKVNELYY